MNPAASVRADIAACHQYGLRDEHEHPGHIDGTVQVQDPGRFGLTAQ
jgi:hypothetical protein